MECKSSRLGKWGSFPGDRVGGERLEDSLGQCVGKMKTVGTFPGERMDRPSWEGARPSSGAVSWTW